MEEKKSMESINHKDQINELEGIIARKSREGGININEITDILRERSGTFSEPEALLQMIQAVLMERKGQR
jgi:hypothetical protein